SLIELSSPIVTIWEKVLTIPIIGILDSNRTQTIMENLLSRIVETGSKIAIIDITGVGIIDTQVANHLLKTVSAVKLLGADAIITGIRPEVAQTIVNLGVELGTVITRATLADGLNYAFKALNLKIVKG
ncbi:MAG: STAS domain-containing protein, partial [Candidatus Hodarchaeota archaeon]